MAITAKFLAIILFSFALIACQGGGSGNSSRVKTSSENNTNDDNPTNETTDNNQSPIARAGQNQTVNIGSQVTLDGSESNGTGGEQLNFTWTQNNGTPVTLSSSSVTAPSFTAPTVADTLAFSLTVTNSQENSASATVTITVTPLTNNHAPIADAGVDQTVPVNALITLNGADSHDADSDSLSYHWMQTGGPSVTLSSTTAIHPNFTSPAVNSTLFFSLIVNDGQQNSLTDTVIITVSETATSHRPVANAGNDKTVQGNTTVSLNGAGSSDPDGDTLSYEWLQTGGPEVTLSSLTIANPDFTAPASGGTLGFALTVNDGQESSLIDTVTIIVLPVNSIPIANAGVDRFVSSNALVTLIGSNSSDIDGDALSYQWSQMAGPAAVLSSSVIANPDFSANVDGRLIFSLIVNDGEADSLADFITVTVGEIPVTNLKVNGTGIIWGGNYPSGNNSNCVGETIDQQDCFGGRDVSHNDSSDGRVGFSYIKISSNGTELTSDVLTWDCVKDQVTGLIWEVKKGGNSIKGDEGLHDADDRFQWYNTDASSNGGADGFDSNGNDVCSAYIEGDTQTWCNTKAFTTRVNTEAYCGFSNWRIPSRKELLSLIDYGQAAPMIDIDYFPAGGVFVWSATPLALGDTSAWGVYFGYGNSFNLDRRNSRRVRLVRSEP